MVSQNFCSADASLCKETLNCSRFLNYYIKDYSVPKYFYFIFHQLLAYSLCPGDQIAVFSVLCYRLKLNKSA